LTKEASDIAGYFSSRVQHLLHLHIAKGMYRYVLRLRHCFKNDRDALVQEGKILIKYITMNAIAMRKILKKYDKVCIRRVFFWLTPSFTTKISPFLII
jgi:E3 ubiquitin-protein ligase BAH